MQIVVTHRDLIIRYNIFYKQCDGFGVRTHYIAVIQDRQHIAEVKHRLAIYVTDIFLHGEDIIHQSCNGRTGKRITHRYVNLLNIFGDTV